MGTGKCPKNGAFRHKIFRNSKENRLDFRMANNYNGDYVMRHQRRIDMNENKDNNRDKKFDSKKTKSLLIILVVSLAITIMLNGVMNRIKEGNQEKITYAEFLSLLDAGEIESVSVESDRVILTPKNQKNPVIKTTYYAIRMADQQLVDRLQTAKEEGKLSDYESPEESGSS